MSQTPSSQGTDILGPDVFNQLLEMLDQYVQLHKHSFCYTWEWHCTNTAWNTFYSKLKVSPKNPPWVFFVVVVLLSQVGVPLCSAHWALEFLRRCNRQLSIQHHSDQHGLHHHARLWRSTRSECPKALLASRLLLTHQAFCYSLYYYLLQWNALDNVLYVPASLEQENLQPQWTPWSYLKKLFLFTLHHVHVALSSGLIVLLQIKYFAMQEVISEDTCE